MPGQWGRENALGFAGLPRSIHESKCLGAISPLPRWRSYASAAPFDN